MVEPATGISGALGALQNVRPASAGGESGSLSGAAQELSSAARGLQATQGAIAGQTMAINQMSIAGQVQTQQMAMMINQLNMSVGQLIGAINTLSGSQRTQAIMSPPPPSAAAAMSGGGVFAAGARGMGNIAGSMVAPFMPGTYMPAQAGQMFGAVGNAGAARSMMMGAGITDLTGLTRVGQQRSNAAEVQRLATERAAFKMGEIMLGAGGGLAGLGASHFGGMAGGALGSRLIGGALGGIAGGMIGGGLIGAAAMAPVNQMMDQVGAMRGSGEMYGRNAFRFNAMGRGDRPGFHERSSFGRSMTQDATSDLLFSNNDMQQMFSGSVENDLMRGVGNSRQAQQRMRQLKESVKIIGQTLGTTIQESMSIMGDLQSVGIGPQNATRALAGANISGLTRQEALQGQMSFMGRFAGTGMQGQGLMGLASQSQQVGQVAMRQGLLSSEQIAGAGGRAGVNQVYGQGMAALMQGSLGNLNMAARMGGGGFGGVSGNPLQAMMQAGGAATTQNLVSFAANRTQNTRDMLNDPMSQARILQQVGAMADQFKGMGSREDIMKLILQQQGVEDPTVFMAMLKAQPQALKEQMRGQQRALAEMQVAQATENFSITGRVGRSLQNVTMPAAGAVSDKMAGVQNTASNMISNLRDEVLGIKRVGSGSGDLTVENLRKLKPSMDGSRRDVLLAKPTEKHLSRARDMTRVVASRASKMGLDGKIREMRETTDAGRKRELANELLSSLSGGEAFKDKDPRVQKAYEQAIYEQFGINISAALNSSGGPSVDDMKAVDEAMSNIRGLLGGSEGDGVFGAGGALAGAAAGGLAGSFVMPGIGTAVGASIGGVWGGIGAMWGAGKSGINSEEAQKISQSQAVREYLKQAQSGGDTVAAQRAMIEELGDDRLANLVVDATGTREKAAAFSKEMSVIGSNAGGMALSRERGGNILSEAMREAGAGSLASSLAGGTGEGIAAAMAELRGMSDGDRSALLGKAGVAGGVLDVASRVKKDMTLDQLMAAGVDERIAKNVLKGSSKLSQEGVGQLDQLLIAKAGLGGEQGIAGTRGGFTQSQIAEQVKLSDQIMRTAELLSAIETGLRNVDGFNPPTVSPWAKR